MSTKIERHPKYYESDGLHNVALPTLCLTRDDMEKLVDFLFTTGQDDVGKDVGAWLDDTADRMPDRDRDDASEKLERWHDRLEGGGWEES